MSNASARVFSQSSVKMVMFPPARDWRDPARVPMMERDRTVIPRTTPRDRVTRKPSRVKVVVVIAGFMECSFRAHGSRHADGPGILPDPAIDERVLPDDLLCREVLDLSFER